MSVNDAARLPAWQRWVGHLARAALGTDPRQRIRTGRSLLAAAVYLVCAALELVGAAVGISDARAAPWVAAGMLVGPVVFYVALRSGWNQRFKEPSLTLPQALCAIVSLTLAYPVNGSVRGVNLMLVAMLPAFAIIALTPRQIRGWLGGGSVVSFSAMMLLLATQWPERFDPRLELIHFVLAATALPAIAWVSSEVSSLRGRLKDQKLALQAALANLELLATHDELTGLCNRSHMLARLAEEARRSLRHGTPLCVALIDIDHFKRINDQHGHAAGDLVLSRFARRGVAAVREIDLLARWGGEEFLLMLPTTSLPAAEQVLARLRLAQQAPDADEAMPTVTFSAGLALHLPADDIEVTIALADAALYQAKASGRDRVVLATHESAGTPRHSGGMAA